MPALSIRFNIKLADISQGWAMYRYIDILKHRQVSTAKHLRYSSLTFYLDITPHLTPSNVEMYRYCSGTALPFVHHCQLRRPRPSNHSRDYRQTGRHVMARCFKYNKCRCCKGSLANDFFGFYATRCISTLGIPDTYTDHTGWSLFIFI